ncbi:MAG TPA: polysaccharide biosynthesis C-terminal domain-containing protein, partial [Humisphaera sp.]
CSQMAMSLLNGLGEARASFAATLVSSAAMVAIAVPLIFAFGLHGSIVGGTVPLLAQLGVCLWMIRRVSRRTAAGPGAAGTAGAGDDADPVAA